MKQMLFLSCSPFFSAQNCSVIVVAIYEMKSCWRWDYGIFINVLGFPRSTLVYPLICYCTWEVYKKNTYVHLGFASFYLKISAFILWRTCSVDKKKVFVNRTGRPSGQWLSLSSSSFTLSVKNTGKIRPLFNNNSNNKKKKGFKENFKNRKLSNRE